MIGVFGGSFDPIHFGHIKTALALLENFEFEQIRFVPCQLSPHKKSINASAQHRQQMLHMICDSHDKLVIDNRELNRPPPSYTIDTLLELRKEFGEQKSIALILGMDAYIAFCKWYRYEEILRHCHLLLLQRPRYRVPESGCEKELIELYGTQSITFLYDKTYGHIFLSDIEKIDVSSTMIRDTIAKGGQPRYAMPGNVWNYIKRNRVYKK